MEEYRIIFYTKSLCPVCLKTIDADIFTDGTESFMDKKCHDHGSFRTVIWKGSIPMEKWIVKKERVHIKHPVTEVHEGCPFDCGLCPEHRQHTCTALIEVTQNCNLHCKICFADSGPCMSEDPSLDQIKVQYESVKNASGICNIQLSGGEPTLRDDLPQIVRIGVETGFNFIQVNTNGIRIGEDEDYVKELKNVGVSSIFLQFDGTRDSIYKKLRGRELLEVKVKAIENCKKYGIGVVLVPTLVPGINVDNIGEIIDFALKFIPTVRGVHFQPVSYFGRVPFAPKNEDRITLPEVMDEIERQTGGKVKAQSLKPPGCENSLCSFHGSYIYRRNGRLTSINSSSACCCKSEKAEEGSVKAKEYVSRNWASVKTDNSMNNCNTSDWDKILNSIRTNIFSISAMAFQDVWNLNIERVKDCCIHEVSPDGRLIPFCLYNLSDEKGRYLYRNKK